MHIKIINNKINKKVKIIYYNNFMKKIYYLYLLSLSFNESKSELSVINLFRDSFNPKNVSGSLIERATALALTAGITYNFLFWNNEELNSKKFEKENIKSIKYYKKPNLLVSNNSSGSGPQPGSDLQPQPQGLNLSPGPQPGSDLQPQPQGPNLSSGSGSNPQPGLGSNLPNMSEDIMQKIKEIISKELTDLLKELKEERDDKSRNEIIILIFKTLGRFKLFNITTEKKKIELILNECIQGIKSLSNLKEFLKNFAKGKFEMTYNISKNIHNHMNSNLHMFKITEDNVSIVNDLLETEFLNIIFENYYK